MAFEPCPQAPRTHTRLISRGAALSMMVGSDARLQVVYGEGGGCTLDVAGRFAGVWIPLRGSLQVRSAEIGRSIRAGSILVTEHDNRATAVGHSNGCWLALLGGRRAWQWLLTDVSTLDARLLPEMHQANHDLRRTAIAVARAANPLDLEGALHALADRITSLQAPLHEVIARCPGRTLARKRQVFMRLQRIRNYIDAFCHQEIDNEALALMANFSPCYFLRTFKAAYLETPHAYLINQRLNRAKSLLQSSAMAITEVALASGFENRCVFSRTFHQHFGMTAQEARHRARAYAEAC